MSAITVDEIRGMYVAEMQATLQNTMTVLYGTRKEHWQTFMLQSWMFASNLNHNDRFPLMSVVCGNVYYDENYDDVFVITNFIESRYGDSVSTAIYATNEFGVRYTVRVDEEVTGYYSASEFFKVWRHMAITED